MRARPAFRLCIRLLAWGLALTAASPALARWIVLVPGKPILLLCDGDFVATPDVSQRKPKLTCGGDRLNHWELNDKLCLYPRTGVIDAGQRKACGSVASQRGALTTLRLAADAHINEGEKFRIVGEGAIGQPIPGPGEAYEAIEGRHLDRFRTGGGGSGGDSSSHGFSGTSRSSRKDLSFGVNAGTSYLYPTFHFQYSPSQHFYFGLVASYVGASQDDVKVTGIGLGVTIALHFKPGALVGPFAQLGFGAYSFSVTQATGNSSAISPFFQALVGYRFGFPLGSRPNSTSLNMRLGIGGLYVNVPVDKVPIDFSGVLPLFLFEAGLGF